jgi:nitrite reductase/ring-hydroxylating ferredoxin subunit
LSADTRFIVCQTHNACYEPQTGECVDGPPAACGKFLTRIPVEVVDEIIYARPPESPEDSLTEPSLRRKLLRTN